MATFTDKDGRSWSPELNTATLIRACKRLDVEINDIMKGELNVGNLIEALWYCCEKEANTRKMTQDDFWSAVTLDTLPDALVALMENCKAAFPKFGDFVDSQDSSFSQELANKFGVDITKKAEGDAPLESGA